MMQCRFCGEFNCFGQCSVDYDDIGSKCPDCGKEDCDGLCQSDKPPPWWHENIDIGGEG